MTVTDRQRFSSSFSDFITRYTAISSTNIRTQTAEYYALEVDDGLTMNLGVNPLLQFGLEETRKALLENILADLSVVKYVPFDSDTIGNPALDLGDVLVFSGGHADETQMACVTGFQIKINGKHSKRSRTVPQQDQPRLTRLGTAPQITKGQPLLLCTVRDNLQHIGKAGPILHQFQE